MQKPRAPPRCGPVIMAHRCKLPEQRRHPPCESPQEGRPVNRRHGQDVRHRRAGDGAAEESAERGQALSRVQDTQTGAPQPLLQRSMRTSASVIVQSLSHQLKGSQARSDDAIHARPNVISRNGEVGCSSI